MEFFERIFGSLASGVIRLAVTEKSFESTSVDTKGINEQINEAVEEVNNQVQVQVEHSFKVAKKHGGEAKAEKLLHCIQRAHSNVRRIERCSKKLS